MPEVYDKRVNVNIKPEWLKINLRSSEKFAEVAEVVEKNKLHTICDSGKCPNKTECWSRRTATFMVLGDVCTRACKFCATTTGKPLPIDAGEPTRVAGSVALMGLRHAVITSVTRDDMADGGANHWAAVVEAVRERNPETVIEVLLPDFGGRGELLDIVLAARPDVVGHNIETVRRLTPAVRSRASYDVSLDVLRYFAAANGPADYFSSEGCSGKAHEDFARERTQTYVTERNSKCNAASTPLSRKIVKSGLMVGLGETPDEVLEAMDDLRGAGVESITLGQYLQPTRAHLPVAEYVTPEMFEFYKQQALARGFSRVQSGPLVRSSYHADEPAL